MKNCKFLVLILFLGITLQAFGQEKERSWKKMPGTAKAIVAGGSKVFAIGADNDALYEWNYKTNAWVRSGRMVKSVAVDFNNSIWTVEGNKIYRYDGKSKWNEVPGTAKAIVAGGSKVFAIGADNDALYEWNYKTNTWVNSGRTVNSVAVDFNNSVWTIEGNNVFRYDGKSQWEKMPGLGKAIMAGGNKLIAIAVAGNDNDKLFEWNYKTNIWVNAGRTVNSAAVDANNTIWAVEKNAIYSF